MITVIFEVWPKVGKAADYFDTSKWQIQNIRRAGVVAAKPGPQSVAA